jgi:hypothetical protein
MEFGMNFYFLNFKVSLKVLIVKNFYHVDGETDVPLMILNPLVAMMKLMFVTKLKSNL